jgi:hypothetical protein
MDTELWWGYLLESAHLEDPDGDGKVSWLDIAQDRVQRQALVLAVFEV